MGTWHSCSRLLGEGQELAGEEAAGLRPQEKDTLSGERPFPGRLLGATVLARDSDDHGLGPGHPEWPWTSTFNALSLSFLICKGDEDNMLPEWP